LEIFMAQIATLVAINGSGTVYAVNLAGVRRELRVGDNLEKGETILTTGGARAELLMQDGETMAVAPGKSILLDDNVVQSEQRPTAQNSAVASAGGADAVIQALERGTDLNEALEATAAGLGGGGAGEGGNMVSFCCCVSLKALTHWLSTSVFHRWRQRHCWRIPIWF
jgi:hypothetical protein